jgi:zinc/manganese transport system substrate-binding protein
MKILAYLVCLSWLAAFPGARAESLHIVAAENFYGGVAQEIAGPDANVHSILTNPNQDPHEFTTSADTAKEVADADIVIYSGIDYDPWMDKLLGTAGKNGRVVIKVSDLVGAKKTDNPHIWYHPKTMPALAAKLADILATLHPAQATAYHQRLDAFNVEMKPLLDKIAAMQAATTGLQVTATEPVFGYMAHALRFVMLNGDFQIKIMNDAEPTADETAAFEKSLTSKTARILFYNSQVTDPTTDRIQKIARESGIPVIGVTETQPPDQKSYVDWMMHQLDAIQAALGAKTP